MATKATRPVLIANCKSAVQGAAGFCGDFVNFDSKKRAFTYASGLGTIK